MSTQSTSSRPVRATAIKSHNLSVTALFQQSLGDKGNSRERSLHRREWRDDPTFVREIKTVKEEDEEDEEDKEDEDEEELYPSMKTWDNNELELTDYRSVKHHPTALETSTPQVQKPQRQETKTCPGVLKLSRRERKVLKKIRKTHTKLAIEFLQDTCTAGRNKLQHKSKDVNDTDVPEEVELADQLRNIPDKTLQHALALLEQ